MKKFLSCMIFMFIVIVFLNDFRAEVNDTRLEVTGPLKRFKKTVYREIPALEDLTRNILMNSTSGHIKLYVEKEFYALKRDDQYKILGKILKMWRETPAVREEGYADWIQVKYFCLEIEETVTIEFYGIPLGAKETVDRNLLNFM